MAKARRRLVELQRVLAGGRSRRTRPVIEAEVADITRARWVRRCLSTSVVGDEPGAIRLEITEDRASRRALETQLFGKRILFTDHEDWSIDEVVAAYRSQWQVEADFRQMKDPSVVSFSPMFHWTDQKIRVHIFYCVLALVVARLMVREAASVGLAMSVRDLLETLSGIEETLLLYPSTGRTATGAPDAHRDGCHPGAALRAVRTRGLRSPAMTRVR
jgi:hypothetical protein